MSLEIFPVRTRPSSEPLFTVMLSSDEKWSLIYLLTFGVAQSNLKISADPSVRVSIQSLSMTCETPLPYFSLSKADTLSMTQKRTLSSLS